MQPILIPKIPLSTLYLDFIVRMLISIEGHDAALLIIDRFSKFIYYIIGYIT